MFVKLFHHHQIHSVVDGFTDNSAGPGKEGLLCASTEMAPQFGGFIEGALEASQAVLERL